LPVKRGPQLCSGARHNNNRLDEEEHHRAEIAALSRYSNAPDGATMKGGVQLDA
jgi:hypothetical protein